MGDDDAELTVRTPVVSTGSLTVTVGDTSYTLEPSDSPITIGRRFPAQIQIDNARISRTHVRLEVRDDEWVATDHSRNGVFLDGNSVPSAIVTDGLTLHLGHPEGTAVDFRLSPSSTGSTAAVAPAEADADEEAGDESGETTGESGYVDPGVERAGLAVAARRRELGIAQRALARDGIINAGALIAFEKGRSWPRKSTLAKLEPVLRWAPGTIAQIRWRSEAGPNDDASERTVVTAGGGQAPFVAQALEVALDAVVRQIDDLPVASDADFNHRVSGILTDLRRLEQIAANAARTATGAPDVVLLLSSIRRHYRDVMLRAARSPRATLGQQLFSARHRAELSAEEAANAAGLTVDVLTAAEADVPVGDDATNALHALLGSLTRA